jgi:hypothetical protein
LDWWLIAQILVIAAAALLLGWRLVDAYRRETLGRWHMLDGVADVLDDAHIERTPWRYPRLRGSLEGIATRIDLIPDTLVQRTLPTLWLQVAWEREHDADVNIVFDRVGTEYMAENGAYDWPLRSAQGWPERTEVRGRGRSGKAMLDRLGSLGLADHTELKQVRISAHAAMVSFRCARAERTTYRFLRAAVFRPDAVKREQVVEALSVLKAVEDVAVPDDEEPAGVDVAEREEAS